MNGNDKWHEDTGRMIKRTLASLTEGVTGIAASDRKELTLSVGHIFQTLRKGQFLSHLSEEWESYRDKGRIKEDYTETEQHRSCLQELLAFLDNDLPDEIRFEVIKKIFLVAASESKSDRNSLMPYQFLRICRSMSSGEMLVLNATYTIAKSGTPPQVTGANQWLDVIAKESELEHASLVEIYEEDLMKKKLITRRTHSDRSGVAATPHFRLSSLGLELCEYIAAYDDVAD